MRQGSVSSCATASTASLQPRPLSTTLYRPDELLRDQDLSRPATATLALNARYVYAARRAASATPRQTLDVAPRANSTMASTAPRRHPVLLHVRPVTADDVATTAAGSSVAPEEAVSVLEARLRALQETTERAVKARLAGSGGAEGAAHSGDDGAGGLEHTLSTLSHTARSQLRGGGGGRRAASATASVARRRALPTDFTNVDELRAALGTIFAPLRVETPSIVEEVKKGAAADRGSRTGPRAAVTRPSHQQQQQQQHEPRLTGAEPAPRVNRKPSARQLNASSRLLMNISQAQNRLRTALHTRVLKLGANTRRERRELLPRMMAQLRADSQLRTEFAHQQHSDGDGAPLSHTRPASRGADGSRSDGASAQLDHIRENKRVAAQPSMYFEQIDARRAAHSGHCLQVYLLRDEHQRAEQQANEMALGAVRGEAIHRDRSWLAFVTFVEAAHCAHVALRRGKEEQLRRAGSLLIGGELPCAGAAAGPSAVGSGAAAAASNGAIPCDERPEDPYKALLRLPVPSETQQRLVPLIDALRHLQFPKFLIRALHKRRVVATRIVAHFLRARRDIGLIGVAINVFLRRCKTLVRAVKRYLLYLQQRRGLMFKQWDYFQAERLHYTKAVCADAERELAKLKKAGAATSFALNPRTSYSFSMASAQQKQQQQQSQSPCASGKESPLLRHSSFGDNENLLSLQGSLAPSPTSRRAPQPRGADDTTTACITSPKFRAAATVAPALRRQQSGAFGDSGASASFSCIGGNAAARALPEDERLRANHQPRPLTDFQRRVAITVPIAAPFMQHLVAIGRFGPDPHSARAVALLSLSLSAYDKVAMKLPPKVRDLLVRYAAELERVWHRRLLREWIAACREAAQQHDWLQHMASIQEGVASSPAKQQLRDFVWPQRPVRRAALNANEMRVLVLVGYSLVNQEKKLTLEITRAGGSPTEEAGAVARQVFSVANISQTLKFCLGQLGQLHGIRQHLSADPPGTLRL